MAGTGTAQEVSDWYDAVAGHKFHPTVIGQLYARQGLKPEMVGGEKIYSGLLIFAELHRLQQSREQGIAYCRTTGYSEVNSENTG